MRSFEAKILSVMVGLAVLASLGGCAEWSDGFAEAIGWRKPILNDKDILDSPALTPPPDYGLRPPEDEGKDGGQYYTDAPVLDEDVSVADAGLDSVDAQTIESLAPSLVDDTSTPVDAPRSRSGRDPYADIPSASRSAFDRAVQARSVPSNGPHTSPVQSTDLPDGKYGWQAIEDQAAPTTKAVTCDNIVVDVSGNYICEN